MISNLNISFQDMTKRNDKSKPVFKTGVNPYLFLLAFCFLFAGPLAAQQTAQTDGMKDNTPSVHALTGATVVTAPGQAISNATLVIRDGVIEAVGRNVNIPADARVWEMNGKTIYPGFIDTYSNAGMQDPQIELERGDLSWNPQLRAQLRAVSEYSPDEDGSENLRSQGFTTAMSVPPIGIFRGETAVFSLNAKPVTERVVQPSVAQSVSLGRSFELGFGYPNSAMGIIALIRQTLYDADWHLRAHQAYRTNPEGLERPESNAALAALESTVQGEQPMLFEARNEEEILRSLRIADEFGLDPWIRGSGHEYQILDILSEKNVPLILPLAFPDAPDVESPESALNQNLSTLRHWYFAPLNPAKLDDAGISFSFSTAGLDNTSQFLANLRKAVKHGLDSETALAALTTRPASLLGIEATHGSLQAGKAANLVVAEGDLFESEARILDVWVDGDRFQVNSPTEVDMSGEWEITSAGGNIDGTLNLNETRPGRYAGTVTIDGEEIDIASSSSRDQARRFRVDFPGEELGYDGMVRLTASLSGDELIGWAEIHGVGRFDWSGQRVSGPEEDEIRQVNVTPRDLDIALLRPSMEYGRTAVPEEPRAVLVRNATIWTMGPQGVLDGADLLVRDGLIEEVGFDLRAPRNAVVIDAEGKHVTPGLIDAHLHSGVSGVNEVGNAIVPEVRLGDVLHINNIWMYRQLAGGLTTAHVMHGSANPIGGQNQHIKMRWGAISDDLKFEGAPRTVKFALGENVKRVGTDRYPETRMGTREIMADRFRMARDYQARWQEWEQNREGIPPRKDLRMEALVDILNEDILVQSHSYRQDEILMLMRLAEEFDFRIKAFHHGVEAYKVAPELAEHGAGAVVWSDWGAFKIEAYDNTVYNARLLHEAGVKTSLHSDNSQIAARMNWEAAKMVRAGMDPEDALSLVTINTAELLGIDDKVGSLEPGKDGDFVIWNGDPLSTLTKAEQTWIDGRKYFDLEEDAALRDAVEHERSELIQLILKEQS